MSITFPLSLPGNDESHGVACVPGYLNQEWVQKKIAAISQSVFTGSIQVQEFQGEWWECTIQVPGMDLPTAEDWAGCFASLRGPVGSILIGDGYRIKDGPLGIATGTPLIKGAAQTGNLVHTDGWTSGVTKILKRGDWLSFGVAKEHLYKVMKDVNSDGSGNADIDIFPAILESTTDNDQISVPGKGQFKLLNPIKYNFSIGEICRGFSFTVVQDI